MTRLDCTVNSCLYNKERCCCKDNIEVVVEAKREFGVLSSQLLTRHNQNLNQMALERGFAIIQSNSMQSPIR